jgi:hypothetical protein
MTDTGRTPAADGGTPRGLDRYLKGALKEIRSTALFSGDVDWDAVHREAEDVLARASGYADTHPFADRDRQLVTGPIVPDDVVADHDPGAAPAAARRWIEGFG